MAARADASRGSAGASTSTVTFRPAQEGDLAIIRKAIFAEKMNPLGLKAERFVVAQLPGGQVAGFGQLAVLRQRDVPGSAEEVPLLEVRSLVTLEGFRGQGIGSQILGHLVGTACSDRQANLQLGRPLVFLTTVERRKRFYERAGFKELDFVDIPAEMRLEWLLGNVVAQAVLKERCLAMGLAKGKS